MWDSSGTALASGYHNFVRIKVLLKQNGAEKTSESRMIVWGREYQRSTIPCSLVVPGGCVQQPGLKMLRNLIAYRHRHISLEHIFFRVFQSCRHDGEMTTPALYHEFMLYPSTRKGMITLRIWMDAPKTQHQSTTDAAQVRYNKSQLWATITKNWNSKPWSLTVGNVAFF